MPKLRITQIRAATSRGSKQRGTIRALGLRRLGQTVLHDDRPEIRGMVRSVGHLVQVEEITDETS